MPAIRGGGWGLGAGGWGLGAGGWGLGLGAGGWGLGLGWGEGWNCLCCFIWLLELGLFCHVGSSERIVASLPGWLEDLQSHGLDAVLSLGWCR